MGEKEYIEQLEKRVESLEKRLLNIERVTMDTGVLSRLHKLDDKCEAHGCWIAVLFILLLVLCGFCYYLYTQIAGYNSDLNLIRDFLNGLSF